MLRANKWVNTALFSIHGIGFKVLGFFLFFFKKSILFFPKSLPPIFFKIILPLQTECIMLFFPYTLPIDSLQNNRSPHASETARRCSQSPWRPLRHACIVLGVPQCLWSDVRVVLRIMTARKYPPQIKQFQSNNGHFSDIPCLTIDSVYTNQFPGAQFFMHRYAQLNR